MIDYQEALRIAKEHVRESCEFSNQHSRQKLDMVITESSTLHLPYGWVFFFNERRYIEENDIRYMLLGNAPIIVNKETGKLTVTGTAYNTKWYLEKYVEQGFPEIIKV